MSEAHRSDAHAEAPDASADRNAKIEQLLLVGLDHYFAAQYEQAINVWTRALFLDRAHPRARAYIERARSALAERQRESEEMLHNGVAAFHRGEADRARRLLQAAIDGGAPPEEALAVLERLNRLEPPAGPVAPPRARVDAAPLRVEEPAGRTRSARMIFGAAAVMLACVALGGYAAVSSRQVDFGSMLSQPPAAIAPGVVPQELALPVPRRGEMALERARTLAAGGHLHDALAVLDDVPATDPQKEEADRLRASLQRELLALTPMPGPSTKPADGGVRR